VSKGNSDIQINKQTKQIDMKNSILLTIALFAFSFAANADAKKTYEGYVITTAGETLEGKIEMLSPSLNEVKVKFTSNAGKKSTFKAKEVKEYGFEVEQWNNKTRQHFTSKITYVKKSVERSPIAFGPKEVLIERQVTGSINMYNHFVEMNSNVKMPFEHVVYVEKTVNELVSITKKNYRTVLKEMTAEYPELQAKVGSRGHGFKHVAQIIETFNNWMLDNGEEIVLGMN
jgi:hypothetical protein